MDDNDLKTRMSNLPKRGLSERDRDEIWEKVDRSLREHPNGTRSHPHAIWAVAAAVLLVCFGSMAGYNQWRLQAQPTATSERSSARQASVVGESIGRSWRVIVVPSLLKKGPYYDFLYLYTGKAPALGITVQTPSTALTGASNQALEPDTVFAGARDAYLPQGPRQYAMTFHWTEKNQKMKETLDCGNITGDIRVARSVLSGSSKDWRASYTEDALSGGQIGANPNIVYGPLIHGTFVFHYTGVKPPASVQFKVTESLTNGYGNTVDTGTLEAQEPASKSTYLLPIDQEGQSLIPGQLSLHVQLTWNGRSEQFNLTRQ